MIEIKCHDNYQAEKRYIIDVLFDKMLGVEYRLCFDENANTRLYVNNKQILSFVDVLFKIKQEDWLTQRALPTFPLEEICIPLELKSIIDYAKTIPLFYSLPRSESQSNDFSFVDLFGSCFFLLTRYEEVVIKERDKYGRFPLRASVLKQEDWLQRPLVDEYCELLKTLLDRKISGLHCKKRTFTIKMTHDIDHLKSTSNTSWLTTAKQALGDVIVRKNVPLALQRVCSKCCDMFGSSKNDPGIKIIHDIIKLSEQHGLTSHFYFIYQETHGIPFGADYTVHDKVLSQAFSLISERGHTIGYHAGFETYQSEEKTKYEVRLCRDLMKKTSIEQKILGGRQHYLKWSNPVTWQNWQKSELTYDATLGFAESVGFRCGTSKPYPVFDLLKRQTLRLLEFPLIAMDETLFSACYMGLDFQQGMSELTKLAKRCRHFGGTLCLLFHNEWLMNRQNMKFYKRMLKEITSMSTPSTIEKQKD